MTPAEEPQSWQTEIIDTLMSHFKSNNWPQRERARKALLELGKCVVPQLIKCLSDLDYRARWEAAKTLLELEDPTAAPALVEALGDPVQEVRWLASEALIALNENALPPLMRWMARHDDSKWLRESAYHVLYSLERKHHLRDETLAVLNALRDIAPQETVSYTAHRAFVALTEPHHAHLR